ncbi:MAG: helicase-related protein, partial [Methylobacter sp.]
PVVTGQLKAGIKSIVAENNRMSIPYGRTVYRKGTPEFNATAKRMALINRTQKGAAVAMNEAVTAKRTESGFIVQTRRGDFTCDHDTFFSLFTPENEALEAGYWEEIHPAIFNTFPAEISRLMTKARQLSIDQWLTWDFQLEDLYELAFKPTGGICGWQMALGKSRLAISLALLLKGKSLIILKSRLVPEMVNELKELGISDYRVIQNKADIEHLGKINIISYERLKRAIHPKYPKLTLAKFLRKKVPNVLCDEGGLLANHHSLQTRAVWQLGAKRKYILDGTPSPNYPREMLNLAAWAFGEERAYQPYSMSKGFIEARLFNGAENQPTGRDEFNRQYVTVKWATNEFLDSGVGAKREVPEIKPAFLQDFRSWVAPMIKRRVQQEPAVSRYVKFPVPELREPTKIDWDFDHLLLYVKTVEKFANWYKTYAKERGEEGKSLNLTMILARLEACFKATNVPSAVSGYGSGFQRLTTKEIACLDLIKTEVSQGLRPIVFARNPAVLHRLSAELNKRNITNLVFSGEETIKKRIKKLNARIRQGNDQVMLASLGVTQDGLNLPQLNSVIFYNRSYSVRQEMQAIYRLIRPQQKNQTIKATFLHLQGSIDEYMGQLIAWKTLASEAGLDYGEQSADEEFVHFDAFIYRFINSLPELKEKLDSMKKLAA